MDMNVGFVARFSLFLDGLVFVLCSCLDMVCHCAPCGLLNRPI